MENEENQLQSNEVNQKQENDLEKFNKIIQEKVDELLSRYEAIINNAGKDSEEKEREIARKYNEFTKDIESFCGSKATSNDNYNLLLMSYKRYIFSDYIKKYASFSLTEKNLIKFAENFLARDGAMEDLVSEFYELESINEQFFNTLCKKLWIRSSENKEALRVLKEKSLNKILGFLDNVEKSKNCYTYKKVKLIQIMNEELASITDDDKTKQKLKNMAFSILLFMFQDKKFLFKMFEKIQGHIEINVFILKLLIEAIKDYPKAIEEFPRIELILKDSIEFHVSENMSNSTLVGVTLLPEIRHEINSEGFTDTTNDTKFYHTIESRCFIETTRDNDKILNSDVFFKILAIHPHCLNNKELFDLFFNALTRRETIETCGYAKKLCTVMLKDEKAREYFIKEIECNYINCDIDPKLINKAQSNQKEQREITMKLLKNHFLLSKTTLFLEIIDQHSKVLSSSGGKEIGKFLCTLLIDEYIQSDDVSQFSSISQKKREKIEIFFNKKLIDQTFTKILEQVLIDLYNADTKRLVTLTLKNSCYKLNWPKEIYYLVFDFLNETSICHLIEVEQSLIDTKDDSKYIEIINAFLLAVSKNKGMLQEDKGKQDFIFSQDFIDFLMHYIKYLSKNQPLLKSSDEQREFSIQEFFNRDDILSIFRDQILESKKMFRTLLIELINHIDNDLYSDLFSAVLQQKESLAGSCKMLDLCLVKQGDAKVSISFVNEPLNIEEIDNSKFKSFLEQLLRGSENAQLFAAMLQSKLLLSDLEKPVQTVNNLKKKLDDMNSQLGMLLQDYGRDYFEIPENLKVLMDSIKKIQNSEVSDDSLSTKILEIFNDNDKKPNNKTIIEALKNLLSIVDPKISEMFNKDSDQNEKVVNKNDDNFSNYSEIFRFQTIDSSLEELKKQLIKTEMGVAEAQEKYNECSQKYKESKKSSKTEQKKTKDAFESANNELNTANQELDNIKISIKKLEDQEKNNRCALGEIIEKLHTLQSKINKNRDVATEESNNLFVKIEKISEELKRIREELSNSGNNANSNNNNLLEKIQKICTNIKKLSSSINRESIEETVKNTHKSHSKKSKGKSKGSNGKGYNNTKKNNNTQKSTTELIEEAKILGQDSKIFLNKARKIEKLCNDFFKSCINDFSNEKELLNSLLHLKLPNSTTLKDVCKILEELATNLGLENSPKPGIKAGNDNNHQDTPENRLNHTQATNLADNNQLSA